MNTTANIGSAADHMPTDISGSIMDQMQKQLQSNNDEQQ